MIPNMETVGDNYLFGICACVSLDMAPAVWDGLFTLRPRNMVFSSRFLLCSVKHSQSIQ